MSKDDYIKFRCTTEFKKKVEENAARYEMNTTNYLEMLIRKDVDNMMYVFNVNEIEQEVVEGIFKKGLAVKIDDNHILSKMNKIITDNISLKATENLEKYISWFDSGESIEIIDGLEIGKSDAIETLLGELDQPCDDNGSTYMDRIYNSDNPDKEIEKLINEFLLLRIDFIKVNIESKLNFINGAIKNNTFEW